MPLSDERMGRRAFREGLVSCAASSGLALMLCNPQQAVAQPETTLYDIDVPESNAADALNRLAAETGATLLFPYDLAKARRVNPTSGRYTLEEALKRLLRGTGLTGDLSDKGVIKISPVEIKQHNDEGEIVETKSKVSFLAGLMAFMASSPPHAQGKDGDRAVLEEVIVTAQKRQERLLDVPMSITALSGESLQKSQSFRFEDYVGSVPGLTLVNTGGLGSQLIIRGVNGALNTPVATYIDESPYVGVGLGAAPFLLAPNLDTYDMQRIEVLKGPQGTLYGASAQGGVLKYVTNAPDPSVFSGSAESGVSSVSNGGTGFDIHGMINIPLTHDAALRVVGYQSYYPGFIDDPSRGVTDINGSRFSGGRASLLYVPADNLSVKFNALYQRRAWSDWPTVDVNPGSLTPIYGALDRQSLISQPGFATNQLYNLTVSWDAGFAKLVSASSYMSFYTDATWDYSKSFGPLVSAAFGQGKQLGFFIDYSSAVRAITQEIRLASPDDRPIRWQVGGYFTNEHSLNGEPTYLVDASTRATLHGFLPNSAKFAGRYREYAGFADLNFQLATAWDAAAGIRYSKNNQVNSQVSHAFPFGDNNFSTPSSESATTYSGDVRYHLSQNNMFYAHIASGFVPGGPASVNPAAPIAHTFSSSTTVNYEVGVKSRIFDDRVTANLAIFDVQWHDIQLLATIDGFSTDVNGGTATSRGVEWDFAYAPVRGLEFRFNGAYTDAYLTEDTPASVNGHVGDRLGYVPLWQTSFGAQYDWPLFATVSGFAGADWQFLGKRLPNFEAGGPRQHIPASNIVDVRSGVQTDRWSATLFVKNVGNKLAINNVGDATLAGSAGPQSATVHTPRTIGLQLTASF